MYPTSKAEQALKRALTKWGRLQIVHQAATADLVIVLSDCSSSKRMVMERVTEGMAVFAGGTLPAADAVPLWAVEETGGAFENKRPTGKLVEDLRKDITKMGNPLSASTTHIEPPAK
ncbi:MAG TPA: hypothetical protein VMU05_21570 [Dongiaceae bacterium]|nr:hypothetical protein [Dongiaceae bacterium]